MATGEEVQEDQEEDQEKQPEGEQEKSGTFLLSAVCQLY